MNNSLGKEEKPNSPDNTIPVISHCLNKTLSNDPDNTIPIIGHASSQPLRLKTIEGEIAVITQMKEANMEPLATLENLPNDVRMLITWLKPNTLALYDKDDAVYVEITLAILRSYNCFMAFLSAYHYFLAPLPLKPYVELVEATEQATYQARLSSNPEKYGEPMDIWLTRHFYVAIHVKDMILDGLKFTFASKNENADIAGAVDYLSRHGLSDSELEKDFGVTERTIQRYKLEIKKKGDKLSQETNGIIMEKTNDLEPNCDSDT